MDFDAVEEAPSAVKVWGTRAVFVLVAFVAVGLLGAMVKGFLADTGRPKKVITEVTLLKPPPPPPPPKQEEKPPEPEVKKDEVKIEEKIEQPKPVDNDPPPALKPMGLDADGAGPGDGFGLLANKGGTDIINTAGRTEGVGGNGTGVGAPMPEMKAEPPKDLGVKIQEKKDYRWYTLHIQSALQDALSRNDKLQGAAYVANVRVWLDKSGAISRYELVGSTGDNKTDTSLQAALGGLPKLAEAPPEDMPQPIRIRITSRL